MHDIPGKDTTEVSDLATVTRYLRQYWKYLAIGGVCIALANILILILPYTTKLIFDALERGGPHEERLELVSIMIGLAILSGGFRFLTRRTVIWMSRKVEYDLRGHLLGHLLRLSPTFYDNNRTGDLMVRLTSDMEAVRMMVGPGIMHITNTIVTVVVALAFMVYLSPKLTMYALAPMIFIPLAVTKLGNLVHQRARLVQDHFSVVTATVQENIAGMRVVKAFRQEKNETEHFRGLSNKYLELNLSLARLNAILAPVLMLLASGLTVVVLYFGGRDVIDGRAPLGTLVAFFAYLSMLFWPAIALGWVISLYQRGTASLKRINLILDTPQEVELEANSGPARKMKGKIELRDLHFGYDQNEVLRGIDLVIEPGETIGVVGVTGSGKTTLISLLARLYPTAPGQILIDDTDLNDWDVRSLRQQMGFATQEPFLFSDSVEQNVLFGAGEAPAMTVSQAAEIAALAKDAETFPRGYDTVVGERGITLSGGQKQRTTIARAIMIDPAVIVLDDATSAVDTETEDEINRRIKSILTGRTAIIISHRVSSVKEADRIIYLVDGRIGEQGSHDELLAQGGRYAELYRAQLLAKELEQL